MGDDSLVENSSFQQNAGPFGSSGLPVNPRKLPTETKPVRVTARPWRGYRTDRNQLVLPDGYAIFRNGNGANAVF
jgi:hypothetical protein